MRDVETAILGAGPAGLFCAARLAERETIALVTRCVPPVPVVPRLEVVPYQTAQLIAQRFGALVGLEPLAQPRVVAWDRPEPTAVPAGAAIIDRSIFDRALFDAVLAERDIAVVVQTSRPRPAAIHVFGHTRAARIIDATGRASVTATGRIRLERPFYASTAVASRPPSMPQGLMVAALPAGYVVRIASERELLLTFYGPRTVDRSLDAVLIALREASADFILDDLPPHQSFLPGNTLRASIEVFLGPTPRIGDAGFARDAMSSQGLAAALSDALYRAAASTPEDHALVDARRYTELHQHISTLEHMASICRYAESPVWTNFRSDLSELRRVVAAALGPSRPAGIVLQDGSIAVDRSPRTRP